jgi:hypothetical protein
MEQRNFEPLMILFATGMFIFMVAAGIMHVFPGKPEINTVVKPVTATAVSPAVQTVARPDSLQALLAEGDSISSMHTGLEHFYQSIDRIPTDHALIHIAYFGDSMIEGDLVTQPLRRYFQKKFGGSGIGFVPVTTPLPGFRTTVKQSFNDGWNVCSFVHPRNNEGAYPGISGYVYISEEGAEARFESPRGYVPFHRAEIIFGGKNDISVKVFTDTATSLLSLSPANPVSSFTVSRDTAFSAFEMNVTSGQPGVFYGVNFEYGPGVYVDNYAFRGNSGLPLTAVPAEIFSGFNAVLGNKLLIIHYGLNVFTPGVEDYHWYEMALDNVIKHVKQSSPGVSILVISMPDRAALISGEYQTPAGLPEFIRMQKRVAAKENVAFFNLYEAMGGMNSMKKWVEGHPKLAGDDYTHPNGAGASKIASLVYEFLMNGYEKHLRKTDSITNIKPTLSAI